MHRSNRDFKGWKRATAVQKSHGTFVESSRRETARKCEFMRSAKSISAERYEFLKILKYRLETIPERPKRTAKKHNPDCSIKKFGVSKIFFINIVLYGEKERTERKGGGGGRSVFMINFEIHRSD